MSMMSGKDGGTARRLGKNGPDDNASSDNGGDRRRGANGVSMGRCVATGLRGGAVAVESIIVCLFMSAEFGFYEIRLRFTCKWTNKSPEKQSGSGIMKTAWAGAYSEPVFVTYIGNIIYCLLVVVSAGTNFLSLFVQKCCLLCCSLSVDLWTCGLEERGVSKMGFSFSKACYLLAKNK
jgi:hypothetical protein